MKIETKYSKLSEKEKDSDREQALNKPKTEEERFKLYNNGWEDCKAEVVKLIMKDYAEHPDCCINNLLNKIDKI